MCRVLRVSRSGYYDWRIRPESRRQRDDKRLLRAIGRIHTQSREHYGLIKCWKQLNNEGYSCGRDRVARLRQAHNIYAKRRRRFVVTTRSRRGYWVAPNRLKRNFHAAAPNGVWVGDVTHIATRAGGLYLSILLDLYSRKVVG